MKKLIVLCLVAASLLVTASAEATTPPPLSGEFLGAGSTSGDGGTFATSAICSQTSPSTITYTATGTEPDGFPYPGSFSESGFVTISNTFSGRYVDGIPFYQVASVDAFFTIDSPVGEVSGTEHQAEPLLGGLCDTYYNQPFSTLIPTDVTGFFRELLDATDGYGQSYDAIITTSGGTFEDTGIAGLQFGDLNVTPEVALTSNVLNEAFQSNSLTAVPGIGDATGGGQISANGNPVAFGFEAKSGNGLKGQCDVVDKTAGVKIHCSDVTSFAQVSPTEVKFFGHATVNGTASTYAIDTQDSAEPGIGSDSFEISTGTGYSASGTLTAGNVQVHSG